MNEFHGCTPQLKGESSVEQAIRMLDDFELDIVGGGGTDDLWKW